MRVKAIFSLLHNSNWNECVPASLSLWSNWHSCRISLVVTRQKLLNGFLTRMRSKRKWINVHENLKLYQSRLLALKSFLLLGSVLWKPFIIPEAQVPRKPHSCTKYIFFLTSCKISEHSPACIILAKFPYHIPVLLARYKIQEQPMLTLALFCHTSGFTFSKFLISRCSNSGPQIFL